MVTITDDAANSPQIVNLTGTGVLAVNLTPASLNFGSVVVNNAKIENVTLKNQQSGPVTITSITGFSNGYTLDPSTTCPMAPVSIPGNNSTCTIAVNLTATGTGPVNGSFTVNYQGLASQTVNLSANSFNPVVITPSPLAFSSVFMGANSQKTLVLKNEQSVPLHITSIPITGSDSGDFGVTSGCPATVAPGGNCILSVTFAPAASGTRTAALEVMDDALGSPQTINLTGSGNAPVLVSPTSITNFTASVGTTSPYHTITIKNQDPINSLMFAVVPFTLNGDYTLTSTTCPVNPATLAPQGSCAVTVSFDPTIGGTRAGQLQINDLTPTTPQVVNLSGTGTDPLTRPRDR